MKLRYAYNTNGCAHHRLDDALAFIAEAGYAGVALTLDHHHFDPFAPGLDRRATVLHKRLTSLGLGLVVETGARYLLDPRRKHAPTLLDPDPAGRARRVDFITRALDIAATCGAEAVSLWAGVRPAGISRGEARRWLYDGLAELGARAQARGVTLALEPEPGHLVETCADYGALAPRLPGLALALDVGHLLVTGEADPPAAVLAWRDRLGTVAIEDMKRGVHVHRMFGEGDLDLPATLGALHAIEFDRLICVELSRDSHRAHETIPGAIAALRRAEEAILR